MGWLEFVAAFAVFLGLHAVPVRPPVKSRIVAQTGARMFTLIYSCVSLLSLAWLIAAAARAPYVALWSGAAWQGWVLLVAMLLVCLIVALVAGRPNPFSFGGRSAPFDATRPGIVRLHRHPLLVALALWSGAHLVANGDLAHVLMFGVFAAFSLLGMAMIDRRKQRLQGDMWHETREALRKQPLCAALHPPGATLLRIAAGVIAYAALLGLHPVLFGASPLP